MAISNDDRDFLQYCRRLAVADSHDPSRTVGALVVLNGDVIGQGTNRPPARLNYRKSDSAREIARDADWKYYNIEHAEREAINNVRDSGKNALGATMYTTLFPCADCARAIIAAGIVRLVAPYAITSTASDTKWRTHFEHSQRMLHRARVDLQTYSVLELSLD